MSNNKYPHYRTLRLILGDQLNAQHSWFRQKDNDTLYIIAELNQEARYVKHHLQKLTAFFLAMEQFAKALTHAGHQVRYLTLDDTTEYRDLPQLLRILCEQHQVEQFEYQQPDEYRLSEQLKNIQLPNSVSRTCADSEHFYLAHAEISDSAPSKSTLRMEHFYRKLRVRFDVLMEGKQPQGGRWNYDKQNRNSLKAGDLKDIPEPLVFANNVEPILQRLKQHKVPHFGHCDNNIVWPCTRRQARQLLKHFCENCLPLFGKFQDAMTDASPHAWTLYHSRLSFALNSKMLSPHEVINSALDAHSSDSKRINLAQIEGFVRQILGWREYVRVIYWANMPSYSQKNHLNAQRQLPDYFWSADTKMRCMQQSIQQSLDYAYAHHIQRLMVTGNFCLLTGISPDQVDSWYLGIYIDAIEWVELPNTRGMSQYADGGLLASKPYISGGNYLHKMSDYCRSCHYNVRTKTEADSCPFNSLYWHFLDRHRSQLVDNHRLAMPYRTWDKMDSDTQEGTLARGQWCLDHIKEL